MCFELADPRGPQRGGAGAGGGGWPVKGGGGQQDERAAAGMAMAAGLGPGTEVLSEYHQARELSTMVSALAHVVAGGPWGDEAPAPRGSGGAPEQQQAMHGGYVREVGSYHGAPSPEFAAHLIASPPARARVYISRRVGAGLGHPERGRGGGGGNGGAPRGGAVRPGGARDAAPPVPRGAPAALGQVGRRDPGPAQSRARVARHLRDRRGCGARLRRGRATLPRQPRQAQLPRGRAPPPGVHAAQGADYLRYHQMLLQGATGNQGTLLPFYAGGGGGMSDLYGGGGGAMSNPYGGGGGGGNTSGFLGSYYSFPPSSVSVATVPSSASSASGYYYSSPYDSHQSESSAAASDWNWETSMLNWSDSGYPPPPHSQ